jgi:hypothetical protein
VDVHQIEFVDQSMTLQQLQRAVDGAAIHTGIQLRSFCDFRRPQASKGVR